MYHRASSSRNFAGALQGLFVLSILWVPLGLAGTSPADNASEQFVTELEAVVAVWDRQIAVLRSSYEEYSPHDRDETATNHILEIPSGEPKYRVEAIDATEGNHAGAWIKVNGKRVFGVLRSDADGAANESFEQYKATTVSNLKAWLEVRDTQQRWPLCY